MTGEPDADDWAFGDGGFAKLYGDRLAQSSLLDAAVATRWVFVFMLSQADKEGRVRCASVAALARAANVSLEDAEKAIRELEAPDPDSTTKDHEGRRLVRIPGGWQVLSYARYRSYQTLRQRAEAEKKQRQRDSARQKRQEREAELARREAELRRREAAAGDMSRDVPRTPPRHPPQTSNVKRQTPDDGRTEERNAAPAAPHSVDVPSSKAAAHAKGNGTSPKRPAEPWTEALARIWAEVRGGEVHPGRLGRVLGRLVRKHGEALVAAGWRRYLEAGQRLDASERRYLSAEDFARRFADFVPQARPPEPPPEPAPAAPIFAPSRDEMDRARAEGRQWW